MSNSENEDTMLVAMDGNTSGDLSDQQSEVSSEGSTLHDDTADNSQNQMTPEEIYDVEYNGFTCSMGRIFASRSQVERIPGNVLKDAFLLRITSAGKQYLSDEREFIRYQLQHYGVHVKEETLEQKAKALAAFQDALAKGLCDSVPHFLLRLHTTLHRLWIDNLGGKQRAQYPDYLIRDRFLTSGQPDHGKTQYPISFYFDSETTMDVADALRSVTEKVEGLICISRYGARSQIVVIGWNLEAITREATTWAANEFRMEAQKVLNLITIHDKFLDYMALERQKYVNPNPVGTYLLFCDQIEGEHSEMAQKLLVHFTATPVKGVYDSLFHFGRHQGLIVIGEDDLALLQYFQDFKNSNIIAGLMQSHVGKKFYRRKRNMQGFRTGFSLRFRRERRSAGLNNGTAATLPKSQKHSRRVTRSQNRATVLSRAMKKGIATRKAEHVYRWLVFSTPTHHQFAKEEKLLPKQFSHGSPPSPNLDGKVLRQGIKAGRVRFSRNFEFINVHGSLDADSRRLFVEGIKINDQHFGGGKKAKAYQHPELDR
ncbi:hypothetical protein F5Y18DRAFT_443750 [Xylariaceae sp. FL1019]|nr:hypothetical protein F5Y18DRAFT_443750 [Xylariaceae sp. FL1019]